MKDIKEYILESQDTFLDAVKNIVKSNKCDYESDDSKNEICLRIRNKYCQYPYSQVTVCLNKTNARNRERIPRVLYTSHNFDNEQCYVKIIDWEPIDIKKNHPVKSLSKKLFDDLTKGSLKEATDGKNPQWGSWKFAIRDEKDEDVFLKCFTKYCKKLGNCK